MSEEVKVKISQPMFEVGELERFDNNIHSIVEEYSKLLFKEKDQILTQRIIMKQEEEIERLNNKVEELMTLYTTEREVKDYYKNIINELEKTLKDHKEIKVKAHYGEYYVEINDILDKLQELKEGNKE